MMPDIEFRRNTRKKYYGTYQNKLVCKYTGEILHIDYNRETAVVNGSMQWQIRKQCQQTIGSLKPQLMAKLLLIRLLQPVCPCWQDHATSRSMAAQLLIQEHFYMILNANLG